MRCLHSNNIKKDGLGLGGVSTCPLDFGGRLEESVQHLNKYHNIMQARYRLNHRCTLGI